MRAMGGLAHAFLTTSDDDVSVTKLYRLHTHGDRTQAGSTKLIDLNRRRFDRYAGLDGRLPRRVLAGTRGEDLTEQNFIDICRVRLCPLQGFLDGKRAEIGRGNTRQPAIERADRCACRTRNNNFLHWIFPYDNCPADPDHGS